MLLVHQSGSVKVGEVVRYTLTYTPSLDRILPPPQHLHVKIKNTSAIPLRAAYLHGPYTLYVSDYPSTFDPYVKQDRVKDVGGPDYEPQLKAGGSWTSKLTLPEDVRAAAQERTGSRDGERKAFTWVIEVASQVLFSTTAAVHFELLVGRDEKSVALGVTGVVSQGQGLPGRLEDFQAKRTELKAEIQTKGVFSKAVRLAIDDTESLWNTPPFPSWDDQGDVEVPAGPKHGDKRDADDKEDQKQRKQQNIHLVIVTHGLHSNIGADMLYMKETIDTAAKQANEDAKNRRAELRAKKAQKDNEFGRDAANLRSKSVPDITIAPTEAPDEEDEEQVLVRGFNGNAVKTEKGIQYLGKRLAKYVLSITYPDQPFLPVKSSLSKSMTRTFTGQKLDELEVAKPTHKNSTIVKDSRHTNHNLAYRITSISFIGHSLGGLIQTYAVAYIRKHSPEFFDRIKPVNFIALASPFLGLSNENPVYVRFALDFGLVGRTGQDLGLTWRAPTIARNGWGAMVNSLVNDPHKDQQPNPGSKPLLRILPTGPAHEALKAFRNRTVYSNVVNDGIVPLRTSCLLFLDWRGLERVEKARRENGLIGTMVNWGWNEISGQNATAPKKPSAWDDFLSDDNNDGGKNSNDHGSTVPDARASQFLDEVQPTSPVEEKEPTRRKTDTMNNSNPAQEDANQQTSNLWTGFLSWFKPQAGSKTSDSASVSSKSSKTKRKKTPKIYKRGQVRATDDSEPSSPVRPSPVENTPPPRGPVRGSSLYTNNSAEENMEAPPKTTVFESAGDLLNPPLPPREFLLDPAARPRTIFHDRVYHPEDIPPPPSKRQRTFFVRSRNNSKDYSASDQGTSDLERTPSNRSTGSEAGGMKIEEKIARAYHKDMAWRKVLVSMEPDAHNNMIVRRMFANAYGWPVVKHICDTHFAFTASAQTRDDEEDTQERAKPQSATVGSTGEQVKGQVEPPDDDKVNVDKHDDKEARSKSVDHAHMQSYQARKATPPPARDSVKSLSDRFRVREDSAAKKGRSPSESREARDELSDLVSMANVNATGTTSSTFSSASNLSGTAALHRLARQDSGRWSDRFFEGSDYDSDDDDEYLEELKRARQRGEIIIGNPEDQRRNSAGFEPRSITKAGSSSSKDGPTKQPHPARVLTDMQRMVDEPDMMSPTSKPNSPHQSQSLDAQSLSLTGVGLSKTLNQRVLDPTAANDETEIPTVTEQVAHAAAPRDISDPSSS